MAAVRSASFRIRRGPAQTVSSRIIRSCALVALLMTTISTPLHGQLPAPPRLRSDAAGAPPAADTQQIRLLVGRSTLVNIGMPIARVSLTTPDVADAMVTSTSQLLVHGKAPGTISMFVWDRSGGTMRYEVVVARDLSALVEQIRELFPGEPITVNSNGKDIVLAGLVSSKYVVEKAAELGAGYVEKKENVVNLLHQQEGVATNQVLLKVRFAEVSRSALSELGASLFTGPIGYKDYLGRSTTQQFPAPIFDEENGRPKLVFSDYLNLFLLNTNPEHQLGTLIKALETKGLLQSLAEPNLVAENGKEASFLAGGEYPYPAVQGGTNNLAITVQFKEFGIRLNFTPTVLRDDLINLKVRPEVSSLDFTNAVSLQGFRIPSLSTRRAETEVELQDGQTFAIAGLLNNNLTETMQKIPGIGDIPILGLLFRSRALQKAQTELVVMVTPQILRRGSSGVTPRLPNLVKPYLEPPDKTVPSPPAKPPAGAPRQGQSFDGTGTSGQSPADTTPTVASAPPTAPAPTATVAPAVSPVMPPAPQTAPQPAPQTAPKALQPSKDQKNAEKQARESLKKQAEEFKKQQAESKKQLAALRTREAAEARQREADREKKKAELGKLAREQEAKLAKEKARRDAAAAKAAAQAAKRQVEADRKRAKMVAEAEARLKAAQAKYEAEVQRTGKKKKTDESSKDKLSTKPGSNK